MCRFLLSIFLTIIGVSGCIAQSTTSAFTYYNNFQNYTNDNPDLELALLNAQQLAANRNNLYFLRDLIHNAFAEEFTQKTIANSQDSTDENFLAERLDFNKDLLAKMANGNAGTLRNTARPLFLYAKIEEVKDDSAKAFPLIQEFLDHELGAEKFYNERSARYGLMIHRMIYQNDGLKAISNRLLMKIKSGLEANSMNVAPGSDQLIFEKRAWYRYLYAYVNAMQATLAEDQFVKERFLKTAFLYSPDLTDQRFYAGYTYDMGFLTDEKRVFRKDYLDFLKQKSANPELILEALLKMSLVEPVYKNELKTYYQDSLKRDTPFKDYWLAAIEKSAVLAPSVVMNQIDQKLFSSKNYLGKWILIDFWGTWCGPCREEHPDLEKLFKAKAKAPESNLKILTVACKDIESKVLNYMRNKKYTFPVAMSDNKLTRTYDVQSYPTKILITPKGNYITIPSGIDWIRFIKEYCES